MVGGTIVEVILQSDRFWLNCRDFTTHSYECAIFTEKPDWFKPKVGDRLWWQGRSAMWTPYDGGEPEGPEDLRIPRIGYSGVLRPQEKAVINE